MTKILPFQAKPPKEAATSPHCYREPTAEEAREIVECLKQIEAHIWTLRGQMMSKQAELAATKCEVERLLSALTRTQGGAG